MTGPAKLAYRPIGMLTSMAAGTAASFIFRQVWRRVAHEDDAPSALQSEYPLGKVVLAAAIEGAIFASIRALIDRLGARGFERVTGAWPGD